MISAYTGTTLPSFATRQNCSNDGRRLSAMILRPQQSSNKFTDTPNDLIIAATALDFLNNCAAHDSRIRIPPNVTHVLRGGDPEANRHRQVGAISHPPD